MKTKKIKQKQTFKILIKNNVYEIEEKEYFKLLKLSNKKDLFKLIKNSDMTEKEWKVYNKAADEYHKFLNKIEESYDELITIDNKFTY
jgi:hypothetical protein